MNFYPRPPRGGRPLKMVLMIRMNRFLSTPSARRATVQRQGDPEIYYISIHALREEGDDLRVGGFLLITDFYPRPPRGGRRSSGKATRRSTIFLSTPSARRATNPRRLFTARRYRFLSTPSARRATTKRINFSLQITDFYPRPPRGGRPPRFPGMYPRFRYFYPRPPRGGRRVICWPPTAPIWISIHALREEGDGQSIRALAARRWISIHALREEGDAPPPEVFPPLPLFLSTPSARRATAGSGLGVSSGRISIHALREEGDSNSTRAGPLSTVFLSTPSARRATTSQTDDKSVFSISIHALREEGDSDMRCGWPCARHFYPRPPRGGRRSILSFSVSRG